MLHLLLVFENDVFFVDVVARAAHNFSKGRNFKLISSITFVKFALISQHRRDLVMHIRIQFLHQFVLLVILVNFVLNQRKSLVDNLLIEFELGLLLD